MAWAAKNFDQVHYATLKAMLEHDIEGMSPGVRRVYLEQRLRLLERQIQDLAERLRLDPKMLHKRGTWAPRPLQDSDWNALADLGYLLALREALRQALVTL